MMAINLFFASIVTCGLQVTFMGGFECGDWKIKSKNEWFTTEAVGGDADRGTQGRVRSPNIAAAVALPCGVRARYFWGSVVVVDYSRFDAGTFAIQGFRGFPRRDTDEYPFGAAGAVVAA
jgi:hypothetical protein